MTAFVLLHSSHRVFWEAMTAPFGGQRRSFLDMLVDDAQELVDQVGGRRASRHVVVDVDDLVQRQDGVVQDRQLEVSLLGMWVCVCGITGSACLGSEENVWL